MTLATTLIEAKAHRGLGNLQEARAAVQRILAGSEGLPAVTLPFATRLDCAATLLAVDGAAAEETVQREIDAFLQRIEDTGANAYLAWTYELRAALAQVHDDGVTWEHELRAAHRLYTEMGATGHAERLARELGLEG
jgi:hypothetical protein